MVKESLVESIRNNPLIKGIAIASTCHKINLFADDIILTLTDVDTSLTATSKALQAFHEISYYRVNSSKSLILGFSITTAMKLQLQSIPIHVEEISIPYLGIHLINNPSMLVEANFSPLLKAIQR